MKLAVNFSAALLTLLAVDPDLPVDYIKAPMRPLPDSLEQFATGAQYRPLLPHIAQPGVVDLAHPEPSRRLDRRLLAEILRLASPPHLSTHLDAGVEHFPSFADQQHELDPELIRIGRRRFLEAIDELRSASGLPVAVENIPYYTWWRHFRFAAEPGFITDVCAAADCGFLMDIAHARCSARSLGMDIEAYLAALPLGRVREIHLGGVREYPEGLRDTHTAADDTDYELLAWVLARTMPAIMTIEYGGLPDTIAGRDGRLVPISRNRPEELAVIIGRVRGMMGAGV